MKRRTKFWIAVVAIAILAILFFKKIIAFYTDWLWFSSLGFGSVFWTIFSAKVLLFLILGILSFAFLWTNVYLARRWRPRNLEYYIEDPFIGISVRAALERYIEPALLALVFVLSFFVFSVGAGERWELFMRFLKPSSFGISDPVFGKDIGFYVFRFPFLRYIYTWTMAVLIVSFVLALLLYFYQRMIGIEGWDIRFDKGVKGHLFSLLSAFFLLKCFGYLFKMYELLFSPHEIAFGAYYTDVKIKIPSLWISLIVSLVVGLLFIFGIWRKGVKWQAWGIAALICVDIVGRGIIPGTVQKLVVAPNELAKEKPYIENSIKFTRLAFGLEKIVEKDYPVSSLHPEDIRKNIVAIESIRLWDYRPLIKTYSQIQVIRPYYIFTGIDIDRYWIGGKYKQVMLAARELDKTKLPESARTWVNERLIYTHGYGVCMNPVNEMTPEGLPVLYIKDIPPTVDPAIGIRITRPEIYFGEVGDEGDGYVVVNTKQEEFDYPFGDQNKYTRYRGTGGVRLSNILRKAAFAIRFNSMKLFLSSYITDESRILFRRRIQDAVRTVAPFLKYDRDPYIVISRDGRLFWIQDAYTSTYFFPYSEPVKEWGSYVRNSVKIVIDAYNGKMDFYLFDESDPLARTYAKIFPKLFKPASEMPGDIREHIRYPEDLFRIQASIYTYYHMWDPKVFFGKEDVWAIPMETYEGKRQQMEPYYVIMKLPGHSSEEFMLMLPFTPRNRDNMIAWMAGKCDGEEYGKILVYIFPKDKLIFGPAQIEARINQDPVISREITLWGQRGSKVEKGNLIVMPIEGSIIYVAPLYIQAEQSELPELKRVIAVVGDRVAMAESLDQALQMTFAKAGTYTLPASWQKPEPASPSSVGMKEMIEQAIRLYESAQRRIREGDWAGYGSSIKELGEILRKMRGRYGR